MYAIMYNNVIVLIIQINITKLKNSVSLRGLATVII